MQPRSVSQDYGPGLVLRHNINHVLLVKVRRSSHQRNANRTSQGIKARSRIRGSTCNQIKGNEIYSSNHACYDWKIVIGAVAPNIRNLQSNISESVDGNNHLEILLRM
ncbi:uncharacterized protein LOC132911961 [Bombus pascuorum]|uniref:uncharacterized protein LOC132911961 n=1 Tax=Bombus pascuorum TaxID=65598 RepID=UPI00298D8D50|nr:uncharacterized protein LOC132911961 [Bombus pascuorum]